MQNTLSRPHKIAAIGAMAAFVLAALPAGAQEQPVTAQVRIQRPAPAKPEKSSAGHPDASGVVVWLVPLDHSAPKDADPTGRKPQVVQQKKTFHPHLTVVRAGSVVDFPNRDPFFHNVFSLFDGKRFDLGLYEAGTTNSVRFDHPGVSFLFCNIHPEMSAVVVAVDTPYFAVSDQSGAVSLPAVPAGQYQLHVWYERSLPEALRSLTRTVRISDDSRALGVMVIPEDPSFATAHKNKYGQDYTPPAKEGYQH
jgi:plastocyanin